MILDIRFKDAPPSQYQNVKMTTVYTLPEGDAKPELVIHFYDYIYPQVTIALDRITSLQVTNN